MSRKELGCLLAFWKGRPVRTLEMEKGQHTLKGKVVFVEILVSDVLLFPLMLMQLSLLPLMQLWLA